MFVVIQSVVSDSLWPHRPQHTRLPCPSLAPGVCSNSCPLSQGCHPTILSLVTSFCSCPQSFPGMPSNYLILGHLLLFLPSIFPSIRVFSNELTLKFLHYFFSNDVNQVVEVLEFQLQHQFFQWKFRVDFL